jgi:hypothetical protein
MISNKKIIELARLKNKGEFPPQTVDGSDIVMIYLVSKFLDGGSPFLSTDNPDTIRRLSSLADDIGASIDIGDDLVSAALAGIATVVRLVHATRQ